MKIQQFPSYFKTVGVSMLLLASLMVFLDRTGFIIDYYLKVHQVNKSLNGSYVLPADYVKTSFYMYQFIVGLIIAAFVIIVFSKQKIEDEWIKQKRLIAYKTAFLCGPVLTILFLNINYELIVAINLVLMWIIQYVVFIYLIKVQPYLLQKLNENQSA